jgi:1-acyl-sn-glycerol-3-phosphate acyltransferase
MASPPPASISSPLIAVLRFLGFLLLTAVMVPPYAALQALNWKGYTYYTRAYFRLVNLVLGFTVEVKGTPSAFRPTLFVSNHSSYLDILVMNAVLPAVFVAKTQVSGWPLFGFLARLAKTVFVDRNPRGTAKERDLLSERLAEGTPLILFPEGTSNDGNRVLPFKSSLFAVTDRTVPDGQGGTVPLPVQPVSVAYTRLDGFPIGRALRPFYAWYGDMTLAGHLLAALGLGKLTVEIIFHEPVTLAQFGSRKALASHCHDVVAVGVTRALAGRPQRTHA